jgi:hypothetical protein
MDQLQLINVARIFGTSDEKELRALFDPAANKITNHVLLDSKYRLIDETDAGQTLDHFTFYYSLDRISAPGAVTTNIPLENIVSMKMYKTRIPLPAVMTPLSYKVAIAIREFTAQSYILPSGFKAHWLLGLSNIVNSFMLNTIIENFNDGIFNFSTPINVVNSMTLIFGDPLYQNIFWNDRGPCTVDLAGLITTTYPHNFDPTISGGTYVTFFDFTTADPAKDKAVIDQLNNNDILVLFVGPNQLQIILVSLAGTTPMPPGTIFNIYYVERRIYMPIEFTMLKK